MELSEEEYVNPMSQEFYKANKYPNTKIVLDYPAF